ncbi:hypothetical protein [Niabella ginsengisoli]|uniref:Uncharacterized protein n=1 Tax=Niabella ginsengisoli TaxID=522298 RepID=A0ABS9SR53_9BACT|nr:hypothetical protein [Niabella ginsengisoli]MCH5600856.1 hypothetical protein [Niabella ginsengisoli]
MAIELTKFSNLKITVNAKLPDYKFVKPLISNRNRLEGLPRTDEFARTLRAEVADPLWMLTRQWQLGEFQGEDAGTAYQAKILAEQQQPGLISINEKSSIEYDANHAPLEPLIESEAPDADFYLRVQMGRQFCKFLKEAGLKEFQIHFTDQYPIQTDAHPDDREAIYFTQSIASTFPDGYLLLEDIRNGSYESFVNAIPDISAGAPEILIKQIAPQFEKWYQHLYPESKNDNAWLPNRMEYNFSMELPHPEGRQMVHLEADQYASGKIDWATFDENKRALNTTNPAKDNLTEIVQTFMPTPLQYSGMPNPRFWQMEDSRVDFGKIQTGTSGLLSLLVAEYGLTYSNDWFVLPYEMQANTLCEIKGIMVTDVFGQNILVEPTFKDPEMNWHEFACFRHTERQNLTSPRNRFYLAPSSLKIQQSEPLEKINFMRDEMTNMVWAIESIVPSAAGGNRQIKANAKRFDQSFTPADPEAKIRYLLGTSVPENWIPFVPVHKDASKQEVRLQRARIPNAPIPISKFLTEQPPGKHLIEEEEVPRAGVIVKRMYKRTRWLNGKTYLWIGRSKTTGKGEGWSGLMFDQILSI